MNTAMSSERPRSTAFGFGSGNKRRSDLGHYIPSQCLVALDIELVSVMTLSTLNGQLKFNEDHPVALELKSLRSAVATFQVLTRPHLYYTYLI